MKKQTVFDNWAGGVVTTMRSDALPKSASPRGRNSLLTFFAGGQAVAAKRPGFEILNPSPVSGRPALLGQFEFTRQVAGTLTSTHLLVGNDGSLSKLVGATASALDGAAPTPFTPGDLLPQFATLNNLAFVVNGVDKKKISNATVQNFGIVRPAAPTAVAGAAGTPNGTYEFAISYYNSVTGHQSSLSDSVAVTVAAQKITVAWAAPTDPQVDYVFVHVRKGSIMSEFFQLIVGTTPASAANGGFPIATLNISVNATDANLTDLTILSPDTAENEPPPANLVSVTAHLARLIVADKDQIYISKPKFPESFDPDAAEPVSPNDGQEIVAVGSFFNKCIIWKTGSIHGLFGNEPNTWYVDQIDPETGCTSASSIRYHDGKLYWWSKNGPVRWDGNGTPELIGQDLIGPTVSREVLNHDRLDQVVCEVEIQSHTVLFAVPESGETRNTLLLPWNAKANTWNSDGWNPFDVASLAVVKDTNGKPWVCAANYAGRVFRFGNADTDGALTADGAGVELTLTGVPTSATASTLVQSTATFDTTADKLLDLFVYAIAPDGQVQRRRITANTGTTLTVTPDWDAIPDTTYTYAIAAPHFQWDTKWTDDEQPFFMKRGLFCYSQLLSDSGSATIQVDVFKDYDAFNPVLTYTFEASGAGGIFDVSLFDDAFFGEIGITYDRERVGKKFRAYRLRYSNIEPNVKVALMRCSMEVSLLSEKN